MKLNKIKIISFLRYKLRSQFISKAFIFGSVANKTSIPNDCDIFIITNLTPFDTEWRIFISDLENIKMEFEFFFDIKLNALINTEKEFIEESSLKLRILNRKIIKII